MKVYKSEKMRTGIRETYDRLLSQWGVEVEEMDLETRYGLTHVIAAGDEKNPPLILFHGVGDDSALMWVYNAEYLSRHFRIYAVDTIGGPGKSIPGKAYNKGFDDALWIDDILDKLHLEKTYFAGVSHGGYLVKLYATKRGERMLKGISISGGLSVKGENDSMMTMLRIFFPEALFPTKKNVYKLIKKLSGKNYAVFTENSTLMEHYTYLLRGFKNMSMRYHNVYGFDEKEIALIREKVVFLIGTEDPFEKNGGAEVLHRCKMDVTFYEDAGHGLNHEKAEEINEKIVRILTGA